MRQVGSPDFDRRNTQQIARKTRPRKISRTSS